MNKKKDKEKEKTIYFTINEQKKFSFTQEQYINLEIEYNRYIIYNKLIKNIEKILNIHELFEYNKRKKYENKNIIERFVLECINHGISPHINHTNHTNHTKHGISPHINYTNHTKIINEELLTNKETINNITNVTHIESNSDSDNTNNQTILYNHVFFNSILYNGKIRNIYYFEKMISEYNEKKIKLTPEIILNIEKEFINAEKQFIKVNDEFSQIIKNTIINMNKQVECSMTLDSHNATFTIKYRDYVKIIDTNRYYKLMKNYDKPFPYNIIHMLLRYSIFDTSSQQWSIGIDLYENISYLFDISFETFASPLNFNMNRFCSIFYDTDRVFGGVGSFYNLTSEKLIMQNIKGVFFNPPYLPILMKKCALQCLTILDEMNKNKFDFTIFSFLPNWEDADYIKSLIQSKYMVDYKIVNKGNYILQEKDKGKLITGTFDLLVIVLNSNKIKWDDKKKLEMKSNFNTILKNMKEETKELFYKK
jgi:hypothetical protein